MPILAAVVALALQADPPRATLLLGLDTDASPIARQSYAALYDPPAGTGPAPGLVPLQTLVVHRDGDRVAVEALPFLAVPTSRGFRYMVLEVREKSNPAYRAPRPGGQAGADPEQDIPLAVSTTRPRLFDRSEDARAELARKPTRALALSVSYSAPRWVTSRFYVSAGTTAEVTGGAAAFTAEETSTLAPCAPGLPVANDRLRPWVSEAEYRALVVAAARRVYGDRWDPDESLPWGPPADELETVAFSLEHRDGALRFVALVPLNGNSSRAFLEKEPLPAWPTALATALALPTPAPRCEVGGRKGADGFLSPDGATLVVVGERELEILDFPSLRRLGSHPRPEGLRRVVMEEWALGKAAPRWASTLHEARGGGASEVR